MFIYEIYVITYVLQFILILGRYTLNNGRNMLYNIYTNVIYTLHVYIDIYTHTYVIYIYM